MAKASARQSTVKVATLDGFWMTKTGGEISSEVNKLYAGGTKVPDIYSNPPVTSNLVVSRPYDPDRDAADLARLRLLVGSVVLAVTITDTDKDLIALGTAVTYSDALLVRIGEPNYDANSGEAKIVELEFAVTIPA